MQMGPVPIYVVAPDNSVTARGTTSGPCGPPWPRCFRSGTPESPASPHPRRWSRREVHRPAARAFHQRRPEGVVSMLRDAKPAGGAAVDVSDGGSARLASLGRRPVIRRRSPRAVDWRTRPVRACCHRTGPGPRCTGWGKTWASRTRWASATWPAGPWALPYIGIGGAGYEPFGGFVEIHDKLRYGDIMSYSPLRWTSPNSWDRIFEAILARSGASLQTAGAGRAAAAAPGMRPPGWTRPANAAARQWHRHRQAGRHTALVRRRRGEADGLGTVIGRIVARDKRGREVRTLKVRGSSPRAEGETPPFTIALPASKRIRSLTLLPAIETKPANDLKASKHAPKGRLLRVPRRASAKRTLKLAWRASDRDSKKLTVTLLARRGKSAWRTIGTGPARFKTFVDPSAREKQKAPPAPPHQRRLQHHHNHSANHTRRR